MARLNQSVFRANQLTASADGLGVNECDTVIVDWAEGRNINKISLRDCCYRSLTGWVRRKLLAILPPSWFFRDWKANRWDSCKKLLFLPPLFIEYFYSNGDGVLEHDPVDGLLAAPCRQGAVVVEVLVHQDRQEVHHVHVRHSHAFSVKKLERLL